MTDIDQLIAPTQANVLRSLHARHARYVFVEFDGASEGRRMIRDVLGLVGTYEEQNAGTLPNQANLNIALSLRGLGVLRPGEYVSDEDRRLRERTGDPAANVPFPSDGFNASMRARLPFLGEDDATWSAEWRMPVDALFWISGPTDSACAALRADVTAALGSNIVRFSRQAAALPTGLDHFGFKDGVSQPRIKDVHPETDPDDRLKLGEFVLDLEDESGEIRHVHPEDVLRHATFVAVRELKMYPDRLHALANQLSLPIEADAVKYTMGREPTAAATPLALSAPALNEAFRFGDDPEGMGCPVGAHIRRANPRDGLGFGGNLSNRHRIIRRGLPYGSPGDVDVGLMFLALQSRLEDGFEFIQAHWLNSGGTLLVGPDADVIAGVRARDVTSTTFVRQGTPPYVVKVADPLTDVKGGEYFVLPTKDGLTNVSTDP